MGTDNTNQMASKLLDYSLHVPINLDNAIPLNESLALNNERRAHLLTQLLFYDQVFVPTQDLGFLPAMLRWFDPGLVEEMLDTGAIVMVHRPQTLGIAGNGNGLMEYTVHESPQKPFQWWQLARFGNTAEAVQLQLDNAAPNITGPRKSRLLVKAVDRAIEHKWDNAFFMEHIHNESYKDLLRDIELQQFVADYYRSPPGLDLKWLPDVAPDQLHSRRDDPIDNPVNLIIAIAEINTELCLGIDLGGLDLYTSSEVPRLMKGKLSAASDARARELAVGGLLDLNKVPDIKPALICNHVSAERLWDLRSGERSVQFRAWLRSAPGFTPRELEQEYVASLEPISLLDRWPMKVLRFLLFTTIGPTLAPTASAIASVADSFILDGLFRRYSPKLFFDEMRSAFPRSTSDERSKKAFRAKI